MIKSTKTETIAIKVTPEEKRKIKELAAKQDVTVSKYLYRLIFSKED
jgi:hypothetical protein